VAVFALTDGKVTVLDTFGTSVEDLAERLDLPVATG
jgi:hypothetical protein